MPAYTVHLDKPTIEVSPNLYGIFFEEINWAGDGGLYAELIRNRGFTEGTQHWVAPEGTLKVEGKRAIVETKDRVNIENRGFAGIGVRQGLEYRLNIRIRGTGGGVVAAYLTDGMRQVSNAQSLVLSENWQEYPLVLKGAQTTGQGRLVLDFPANTRAELEWVSMFPGDAVSGIFRKDLFEALKKLKPAFVRFPGGCWVEGETMATAYRWKKTIGPPRNRTAMYNLWRYQSTNGLGYHEYLQLCRDLKAVPMFVANCGMSHREVVPMDQMDEYVQDILDAIEYANGPVTSKWGALRAQHGSPKPFNLKYLEIGNENGGPAYEERYGLIYRAIRAKYPNIVTIANVWGGYPQKSPIEVLDEHYYNDPGFFLEQADRYDRYDRKGPKIYVGEYAVTLGVEQGNLRGALAEAAFMMGMERNADVVTMSSYAPLLAHPAGKAWNPDLIYFDGLNVVETPSFHVQALFAQNRPDRMLSSTLRNAPTSSEPFPAGSVGVGTWATSAEFSDLRVIQNNKLVYTSGEKRLQFESGNWTNLNDTWRQMGDTNGARAFGGDPKWTRYRLEVKAKKIDGDEGFLVTVGRKDDRNFIWLNLGGWGNTQHAIEWSVDGGKRRIGNAKPGRIERGRTYDIAIDYSPERIVCSLDGEVIFDERVPSRPMVFANAGTRKGETIVKLINVDSKPHDIRLEIPGGAAAFIAEGTLLQADDDRATSTLSNLKALVPKPIARRTIKNNSNLTLPRDSLTILRLKTKP
jgi:alpha-L-arabinofuranosidase